MFKYKAAETQIVGIQELFEMINALTERVVALEGAKKATKGASHKKGLQIKILNLMQNGQSYTGDLLSQQLTGYTKQAYPSALGELEKKGLVVKLARGLYRIK